MDKLKTQPEVIRGKKNRKIKEIATKLGLAARRSWKIQAFPHIPALVQCAKKLI